MKNIEDFIAEVVHRGGEMHLTVEFDHRLNRQRLTVAWRMRSIDPWMRTVREFEVMRQKETVGFGIRGIFFELKNWFEEIFEPPLIRLINSLSGRRPT